MKIRNAPASFSFASFHSVALRFRQPLLAHIKRSARRLLFRAPSASTKFKTTSMFHALSSISVSRTPLGTPRPTFRQAPIFALTLTQARALLKRQPGLRWAWPGVRAKLVIGVFVCSPGRFALPSGLAGRAGKAHYERACLPSGVRVWSWFALIDSRGAKAATHIAQARHSQHTFARGR